MDVTIKYNNFSQTTRCTYVWADAYMSDSIVHKDASWYASAVQNPDKLKHNEISNITTSSYSFTLNFTPQVDETTITPKKYFIVRGCFVLAVYGKSNPYYNGCPNINNCKCVYNGQVEEESATSGTRGAENASVYEECAVYFIKTNATFTDPDASTDPPASDDSNQTEPSGQDDGSNR